MHATHTRRPLGRPLPAVFCAAFALASGAVPLSAEEPSQTAPVPPTPPPAKTEEVATPDPASTEGGIAFEGSVEARPEPKPKVQGPSSASLDLSRTVPFIGRRSNTRILSGYYIFAESNQGNLSGIHPGSELPLILRVQLEEKLSRNPDLTRRSNVVGLWASIPLREGSRRRASHEAAEFPNRTLVASIGTEPTRFRTSRKPPEVEVPGQGFFARLRPHTGILDRFKTEPTPTPTAELAKPAQGPVAAADGATAGSSDAKPEEKKAERSGAFDFIRRIRD